MNNSGSISIQSRPETHPIASTRRNHALEHATIHLLSQRFPHRTFIGRSDFNGFTLYGNVETSILAELSEQALSRLRGGESSLAIHPNCGTNLVTSALLTSAASFLAFIGSDGGGWRRRLERFPMAVAGVLMALLISQPLGRLAQEKLTTDADPANLRIISVKQMNGTRMSFHRVATRS